MCIPLTNEPVSEARLKKSNERNARFYFRNLIADVSRCALAAREGKQERYADSLARARKTLVYLRHANRPEAYEEGLLMLRGLVFAKRDGFLSDFQKSVELLAQ